MLGNFIYSKTKNLFLQELEAGNVLDEAIVFIEDTKEIWNHGVYFNGANIKTVNGESVLGSGDINTNLVEITYSDLRSLRDSGLLVPGQYYRITDYVTTCAEHGNHYSAVNTYSAGHQFDIIVMALSEDKLDENASAILHEGDTYFANCAISQWKIDYTIDNDTEKFRWASPDGKGVIYYMEDEHGNACTYDFKNIQYDVPSMSILGTNWKHDTSLYDTYMMGFEQGKRYYTFSFLNDSGEIEDASMVYISKTNSYATNNVIKRPNDWGYLRDLPVIVLLSLPLTHSVLTKYDRNYSGRNISTNKFDEDCEFIFMIAPCERTFFKPVCRYNIIGPSSFQNYFGDYSYGNFIEAISGRNTIGNNFKDNILGSVFYNNTIADLFSQNTIGNFFQDNNIGTNFGNNIIGDYFCYNNVGSTFHSNKLGNLFQANTFGTYFTENILSLDSNKTSLMNNCVGCKFDDAVYTNIFYPKSPYDNTSDYIQNVHVCRGICGTSTSFNYVEIQHKNSESEITITKTSDNNIVEHCVSDWCLVNKVKQSINLVAGTNWISFYVDTTLKELYSALGTNGISIETTSAGGMSEADLINTYDSSTNSWSGNISELDFSKTYKIQVSEAATIEVSGELLNPKDITITLNPGYNWIGYPSNVSISVNEALDGLTPQINDQITGKEGFATYFGENIGWVGSLNMLEPGKGYQYYNSSSETKTFTFPTELDIALSKKQDTLVSGTNIKTINGTSILGSGDITIESGSEQIQADWNETDTTSKAYIANKPNIRQDEAGSISIGSDSQIVGLHGESWIDKLFSERIFANAYAFEILDINENTLVEFDKNGDGTKFLAGDCKYKSISTAYPQVNHGTSDTTFALTPNVLHVWDEVAELSLTLANPTDTNIANEYLFQFTSGATATTLTLPDTIKWANDAPIDIAENMIYQVSILNNCGTILGFI